MKSIRVGLAVLLAGTAIVVQPQASGGEGPKCECTYWQSGNRGILVYDFDEHGHPIESCEVWDCYIID
jgi:hypothetical protein